MYAAEVSSYRLWRVNLNTGKVYLHAGSTVGSTSGPLASTKFGAISCIKFLNDTLYVLDTYGIRMLNDTTSKPFVSLSNSYKSFDLYTKYNLGMFYLFTNH
jgi:hypothetical protein